MSPKPAKHSDTSEAEGSRRRARRDKGARPRAKGADPSDKAAARAPSRQDRRRCQSQSAMACGSMRSSSPRAALAPKTVRHARLCQQGGKVICFFQSAGKFKASLRRWAFPTRQADEAPCAESLCVAEL